MQKRSAFSFVKNAAGIALAATLVGASVAIASVTINNVGISGDSSFTNVTGTASMVWDVGSGNTISLNTNNNGPVTLGTGLFTFTTASGTNVGLTGYLYSASASSSNVSSTNVTVGNYLAVTGQTTFASASGTNIGLTGYLYSANASTSNVSSTRIDATTGGNIVNVSSTRITASTGYDGARADVTNVSSTQVNASTLFEGARALVTNVSSTNATISGDLQVTGSGNIAASTTIRTALINTTSTSAVTVDNCGTSATVVGTPFAGLITVGTGASVASCRLNYPTSTLQFMNPPACVASYVTATTSLMSPLVASSSKNYAILTSTSSTQQIAQLQLSYICVGL